ncbi:MAG: hypothetical protein GDA48_28880 [Hormoscilla sp. GM102CHS1]|nr:hypothetical protein [Hormoscilla sp. GM102CHS1]
MSIFSPFDHNHEAVRELISISSPVIAANFSLEEPHTRKHNNATIIVAIEASTAPSAPFLMRERDIKALSCLFDIDDIDEIEADIIHYLFLLLPDPGFVDDTL